MEIKVCRKCGKELTLDRFDKNHLSKDGLSGICKECKAKYNRNRTLKIKTEKMMKSESVPFNIDESNSGGQAFWPIPQGSLLRSCAGVATRAILRIVGA